MLRLRAGRKVATIPNHGTNVGAEAKSVLKSLSWPCTPSLLARLRMGPATCSKSFAVRTIFVLLFLSTELARS
jgi:hypothetical protein